MNEKEFKQHYVTTFLASYMAGRYDDDCMNGRKPYHPIEDAICLADMAWKTLCELGENEC